MTIVVAHLQFNLTPPETRHLASGTDLTLTTALGETAPDMQLLRANEVTSEDLMGESCDEKINDSLSVKMRSLIYYYLFHSSDFDLLSF